MQRLVRNLRSSMHGGALTVPLVVALSACGRPTPPPRFYLPAPANPADWIAKDAGEQKKRSCLPHNEYGEWQAVAASQGVALVARGYSVSGRKSIRVPGGRLVSSDLGEWGGGVSWVSENGHASYEVVAGNVVGLYEQEGRVVAVAGRAMIGGGAIHELALGTNGRWQVLFTRELEASPGAFVQDEEGGVFIATTEGVLHYRDRVLTAVHRAPVDWWTPTSIVRVEDGVFYVGMADGVARITPRKGGYAESFLVPPGCPNVTRPITRQYGERVCRCLEPEEPVLQPK